MLSNALKLLTCIGIFTIPSVELTSQSCSDKGNFYNKQGPLILATTVDGKLSAININDGGSLLWQIDLKQGPLISSSISKLLYKQDGKFVRLIPSLDGGLFQFDGESVEAVPFDADQLLSSSFRLAEEAILIGGKETTTTGINAQTGRNVYSCTSEGCEQKENAQDSNDIIIIKRYQQTIRSVRNRNGIENWNFSVGQINLDFSKGKSYNLLEGSGETSANSHQNDNFSEDNEFTMIDVNRIKVIVPDGKICMVMPSNKHVISWLVELNAPISSAWLLYEGKMRKLDLFDPTKIPALSSGTDDSQHSASDTIYMGSFGDNMYVQTSPSVQHAIARAASNDPGTSLGYKTPRFTYLSQSTSETRLVTGPNKRMGKTTVEIDQAVKNNDQNQLMLHGNKVHSSGTGYYLQGDISYLTNIQSSKRRGRNTLDSTENSSYRGPDIDIVYSSFMYWWKELLVLTVSISVFVQCLISKCMQLHKEKRAMKISEVQYEVKEEKPNHEHLIEHEYQSRFIEDFEPLECLGKGGFGVVFKARNKMDDCEYAVKRISLPHNENAREKVLREVRALAKLEHQSIVRYFNAWSEQPPSGWQKMFDHSLLQDLSAWSQPPSTVLSHPTSLHHYVKTGHTSDTNIDSFKQTTFTDVSSIQSLGLERYNELGLTGGFNVGFSDKSDSGLFGDEQEFVKLDNNDIGGKFFMPSSSSDYTGSVVRNRTNNNCTTSVPFQLYQDGNKSESIVFGDASEVDQLPIPIGKFSSKSYVFSHPDDQSSKFKEHPTTSTPHKTSSKRHTQNKEDLQKLNNISQPLTVYLYIQMQLCKKESLREWMATNVKSRQPDICIDIFHQVLSAVQYVHETGLIHRDLKPSNVFFSLDGTIKVGDFGLVTNVADGDRYYEEAFIEDNSEETHTQHVGTKLYMAPEQMSSGSYSEKVDIFALGLILFELFNIFGTQMERIQNLTKARKLQFPDKFDKKYPNESRLTRTMLNQDASQRPSTYVISQDETFNDVEITSKRHRTISNRSSDSSCHK